MTTFTTDDLNNALDGLYNEYSKVCMENNQIKIELDFYKTRCVDLENEVKILREQNARK